MSTSPKIEETPVGSDLEAGEFVDFFHYDLHSARRWGRG
jgi:hypothetical protein